MVLIKRHNIHFFFIVISFFVILSGAISPAGIAYAEISSEYWDKDFQKSHISLKSTTGKFYAYIVLLFNENPHFLNLIQEDSITTDIMQNEGFNVREYNNYLESLRKSSDVKKIAEIMLNVYLHPGKFNEKALEQIQDDLNRFDVILRFSKEKNPGMERIVLDYCIYGRKEPINISHPLFEVQEKIFNIQPFIYYDEFSTSNSTFYFDMIYINPGEVNNDYIIAQNIINGKNAEPMFFVGAKINDNIKYCIIQAFNNSRNIKKEILNMFIIHEITHKILNNQYNYYDQITGEELALISTIYQNPYLGLSVLYSYLDYNRINPHRIAAMNVVRFIANKTGKPGLVEDPGDVKYMGINEIKHMVKDHFISLRNNIK